MQRSSCESSAHLSWRGMSATVSSRGSFPGRTQKGLRPADAWVAGNEARINAIKSNISVVEPGDLAKILINNMGDKLITMPDCGTTNGVAMNARDGHAVDRYLAKPAGAIAAGTLLTPQILQKLGDTTLIVRSPMTCEAPHGICQKCQGVSPTGQLHRIGTNVGMRAAQALSEPLTQFSLNAKHGGRISTKEEDAKKPEGIKGVRQVLEVPQSFMHRATGGAQRNRLEDRTSAPRRDVRMGRPGTALRPARPARRWPQQVNASRRATPCRTVFRSLTKSSDTRDSERGVDTS
jgi:hypothetical protein